jgi:hypothetical protein
VYFIWQLIYVAAANIRTLNAEETLYMILSVYNLFLISVDEMFGFRSGYQNQ